MPLTSGGFTKELIKKHYMDKELIVFGIAFGIGYLFGFYNGFLINSVVKPSERRSPTDESFSGCKPPDERQNPQEDFLACGCDINNVCDSCQKINHSNA